MSACNHTSKVYYLGGGIWMCFPCWAKLVAGAK